MVGHPQAIDERTRDEEIWSIPQMCITCIVVFPAKAGIHSSSLSMSHGRWDGYLHSFTLVVSWLGRPPNLYLDH